MRVAFSPLSLFFQAIFLTNPLWWLLKLHYGTLTVRNDKPSIIFREDATLIFLALDVSNSGWSPLSLSHLWFISIIIRLFIWKLTTPIMKSIQSLTTVGFVFRFYIHQERTNLMSLWVICYSDYSITKTLCNRSGDETVSNVSMSSNLTSTIVGDSRWALEAYLRGRIYNNFCDIDAFRSERWVTSQYRCCCDVA